MSLLLYSHMPIGRVWIYRLLFVCLCVFVRLRISLPRTKLAASHFARRFIGVTVREFHILGNFAPQKPKIGRIGQPACHAHAHVNITVEMRRRKRHARDAPDIGSACVDINVSPTDVGLSSCSHCVRFCCCDLQVSSLLRCFFSESDVWRMFSSAM